MNQNAMLIQQLLSGKLNAEQMVRQLCQERNIDVDEFMKMLKQ